MKRGQNSLLLGFADLHLSLLQLPPFIPDKVHRITTCLTVSVDLFPCGNDGHIARKPQQVNHLPLFVLTLTLYQCLLNQRELCIVFFFKLEAFVSSQSPKICSSD